MLSWNICNVLAKWNSLIEDMSNHQLKNLDKLTQGKMKVIITQAPNLITLITVILKLISSELHNCSFFIIINNLSDIDIFSL
jgi:hypothetical protein